MAYQMLYQQFPQDNAPYQWYDPQQQYFMNAQQAPQSSYPFTTAEFMDNLTVAVQPGLLVSSSPMSSHTPFHLDTSMSPRSPITPDTPLSRSFSPQEHDFQLYPSESSSSTSGFAENTCPYIDCTSKGKFKRRTDLNRHIKTQHEAEKNMIDCDHKWCGRTGTNGFSRRDHLREHLREVHRENHPYKSQRRGSGSRSPIKRDIKSKTAGSASQAIPGHRR